MHFLLSWHNHKKTQDLSCEISTTESKEKSISCKFFCKDMDLYAGAERQGNY